MAAPYRLLTNIKQVQLSGCAVKLNCTALLLEGPVEEGSTLRAYIRGFLSDGRMQIFEIPLACGHLEFETTPAEFALPSHGSVETYELRFKDGTALTITPEYPERRIEVNDYFYEDEVMKHLPLLVFGSWRKPVFQVIVSRLGHEVPSFIRRTSPYWTQLP